MTLQQLRNWHRWIAYSLTIFILAHLSNHIAGAFDPDLHIAIQHRLEAVYGVGLIDACLLAGFATQIALGIMLYVKTRKFRQQAWSRAQKISGLVLAFFLIQHILANLNMRFFAPQLETNYYWAASVVTYSPLNWYFIPYYFAGIVALGIHIAAFTRTKLHRLNTPKLTKHLPAVIVISAVLGAIGIIAGLTGAVYPRSLPAAYENYISNFYNISVQDPAPIPAG